MNNTEIFIHYLQIFLTCVEDPLAFIMKRFGMFQISKCEYKDLYVIQFIYFIFILFNNNYIPSDIGKRDEYMYNRVKYFILNQLYYQPISFGKIVESVKNYFHLNNESKIEISNKCYKILSENNCSVENKTIKDPSLYKINCHYKPKINNFSIENYIILEFKYDHIPFSIDSLYNNNISSPEFKVLNNVYGSITYHGMLWKYLLYLNSNSKTVTFECLSLIHRALYFNSNNFFNFIMQHQEMIEILNSIQINSMNNDILNYILSNLTNRKIIIKTISRNNNNNNSNNNNNKSKQKEMKNISNTKSMIAKRMAEIKKKQQKFSKLNHIEENTIIDALIPSSSVFGDINPNDKSNIRLCLVCKQTETYDNPFIFFAFHQITPLYNTKIKMFNYCGHYCHSICFKSIERNFMRHSIESPFNDVDGDEYDFWYILFIYVFLSLFISLYIYILFFFNIFLIFILFS